MRQKLHYLCPDEIPGALLARSGLLFDNPSKCSDYQTTAAGTDLYFGFFQHRGVTRLRRADTQGDKIKHLLEYTRGGRWRPACFLNLLIDRSRIASSGWGVRVISVSASKELIWNKA